MSKDGSYGQILRSSSIIGGASVINIAVGLLRIKVAAVLRWQVLGDVLKVASWPLGSIILAAVALLVAAEWSAMADAAAALIMSAGLGLYSFSRLAHRTSLTGPLGRLARLCQQWLMKIGVWRDRD